MVMTGRRVMLVSLAAMVLSGIGAWRFFYEPPLASDKYFDREAFPEFELTFDGVPLGKQLRLQPNWIVVARSLPSDKFPADTEFLCLVSFLPPRDDMTGMAFVELRQQNRDEPANPLPVMRAGRQVDVTPSPLAGDDPRLQFYGLMQPESAFAQYEYDLEDVVDTPLMLQVWMLPLDETGSPRDEEGGGVLIHRQEVTIVRAEE